MRLFVSVFLILCVCSLTFSIPRQERNASSEADDVTSKPSALNGDTKDQDETRNIQSGLEKTDTDDSEVNIKTTEGRQKFSKRVKHRYNKLYSNKDRKKWRKRRPSNYKKGASKSKSKAAVVIIPYTLDSTRKINQDMDSLLVLVSQYMRDGPGFSFKLATPPNNIKARPWGYVILETAENNSSSTSLTDRVRAKRENDDGETDGDELGVDVEEDSEADEESNDEKDESVTSNPEENTNTQAPSDQIMEQEEATPTKEGTELIEHDEDDEEEDEDTDTKEENLHANSTGITQQITTKLSSDPQPIRQSDGRIEYHLQLLDDEEFHGNQDNVSEPSALKSRTLDDTRSARKRGRFSRPRNQRRFKRPKAIVNGLETIRRSEDITAGVQNGTGIRIYEILLEVGPVYFKFNESAIFSIPVSRISTGILKARLRLKERDGKLLSLRMKALKIRPNNVVVSLKVADEQSTFDDQTARMVTHLSQEMARAWNSGVLIRNVKRSFKQLLLDVANTDDEPIEENRSIKKQSEELLQNFFNSLNDTASSSTSSLDMIVTSDLASTTPLPVA